MILCIFYGIKWQHRMENRNINEIIIAERDQGECSDATIEMLKRYIHRLTLQESTSV